MLRDAGIKIEHRLFISPRAHLIMPYHKILDGLYEQAKGAGATGTTRRGIGPVLCRQDELQWHSLERCCEQESIRRQTTGANQFEK